VRKVRFRTPWQAPGALAENERSDLPSESVRAYTCNRLHGVWQALRGLRACAGKPAPYALRGLRACHTTETFWWSGPSPCYPRCLMDQPSYPLPTSDGSASAPRDLPPPALPPANSYVPLSYAELKPAAEAPREWLWQGFLLPGAVTLLTSLWKS